MSGQPAFERWLQTPRGTLALLGASLAVSALAAGLLASQRGWFESKIYEKWPPVSAATEALGRGLDGAAATARIRELPALEKRALYGGWLGNGGDWPPRAAERIIAADPEFFLARAQGTLLAGSPDQRRRAARFLASAGLPAARDLLARAEQRARARRELELARELRELRLAR